ncbi:P-loop containing nucleoside triphosphate hydrolase [Pseudocohnilembus persalinus]|uniref:p-loop containing nucleoside triphosphate hydrolase n=1 Tax=Pseudocohnilembus persalinus TaxID=266149 RepID=A0A0V0R2D4_PSEPJ|nr:P-loop containing nucleoside triphosphate hydrolase [Pseudocohnilembus persalinus]|eukprot:KRX08660.1 P-loop containing nucleoside triphosphate hydrolase [Pseudocohnilembus persalinus]
MNPDQFDSELKTYYTKIKTEIKQQHQDYLKNHPELREILNDFLSQTLLEKPKDVYNYARDYFSYFNIEEDLVKYQPLIITGPYGSGKSTLIKKLIETYPNIFQRSISYTTRAALPNETHGEEYYFVSKNEFTKEIQKNQFLQYEVKQDNEYFGTHLGKLNAIVNNGKIAILELDLDAAKNIIEQNPSYKFISISAPFEQCRQRIEQRTDLDNEQLKQKLEISKSEIEKQKTSNFKIIENKQEIQIAFEKLVNVNSVDSQQQNEKDEQIAKLQAQNTKLQYRIDHLVRNYNDLRSQAQKK